MRYVTFILPFILIAGVPDKDKLSYNIDSYGEPWINERQPISSENLPQGEVMYSLPQHFGRDDKLSWTQIAGIPGAAVNEFVFSPSSPNVAYASTYGDGVYKSIDGGNTWNQTGLTNALGSFNGLAVDPQNPDVVYAGFYTSGHFMGGTFKTSDGGNSWVSWGPEELSYAYTIAIVPSHPDTIFLGGPEGLFYTWDGGITWNQNTDVGSYLRHITVDPTDPEVIYAARSTQFYRSNDGGASFTEIILPDNYYIRRIVIDPTNPQNIYLGTIFGLLRSSDGGQSWNITDTQFGFDPDDPTSPPPLIYGVSIDPGDSGHIFVSSWYYGVFESLDAGATWSSNHPPVPDPFGYDVVFSASDQQFVVSQWGKGLWRFDGSQWAASSDGLNSQNVFSIEIVNENELWAGSLGQGVSKSVDGGQTWEQKANGLGSWYNYSLAVNPTDSTIALAGFREDGLYLTTNGGDDWTRAVGGDSMTVRDIKYSPSNPDIVYAHGYNNFNTTNEFYRSGDGGLTWTTTYSGSELLFNYGIDPDDGSHLIICVLYDPYGTGRDYYTVESVDGGFTWSWGTPEFLGNRARDILIVPNSSIVLASTWAYGLWRLTDFGWESYGTGLPENAFIWNFEPVPTGDILVDTWGAGIYSSSDFGATWTPDNDGITNGGILSLDSKLTESGLTYVAGTYGGNFLRTRSYQPQISTIPSDTLNFGNVYVGVEDTLILRIISDGLDPLDIFSIDLIGDNFSLINQPVDTLTLPGGEIFGLDVTFLSTVEGNFTGEITILSNSEVNDTLTVQLIADAVLPPDISISPDSLYSALYTGGTEMQTLTITNNGGDDLVFLVRLDVTGKQGVSLPDFNPNAQDSKVKIEDQIKVNEEFYNRNKDEASILLIMDYWPWGADMSGIIYDNFGFWPDVINSSSISSTDFLGYDVVVTVGSQDYYYYTEVSNYAWKFEEYVSGGGVVQYQAATQGENVSLAGNVTSSYGYFDNYNYIETPEHPIVAGLTDPLEGYSANHNILTNLPGDALVITTMSDYVSPTTVEYKIGAGTVIATGMTWGYLYSYGYEAGIMIANSISYCLDVSGAQWISINPVEGTVPAGESVDLEMTFNAEGLVGGDYYADLFIVSNDPDTPEVTVPIHLNVTGAPDITVEVDTLDFEQNFLGFADSLELLVTNSGTDILTISSAVTDPVEYSVSPDNSILSPGDSTVFTVIFNPAVVGDYPGSLTFTSDDPDEGSYIVTLLGQGIEPPIISVSPDSLYTALYTGGIETQILTITNSGGSDLIFSIADEELGVGQRDAFKFLGNLDYTQDVSDVWGYSAPDGTELAIVGTYMGTSFVDASTDPAQPTEIAFIPGPSSVWRDMKTYSHYAYIVTEGGGGLQIVDLNDPMNPILVSTNSAFFSSAHNIFIDESGFAYIAGSDAGGLLILNLSDPENPIEAGSWNNWYVHDVFVRNDTAYAASIGNGSMDIIDVSNKSNPVLIVSHYYTGAFTHNVWLTDDSKYALTTDEQYGGFVKIWDIQDLDNIYLAAEYRTDPDHIPHNVFVEGKFAYISSYVDGVVVLDITDPTSPMVEDQYDTYLGTQTGYSGAWGTYPYAGRKFVYVSDIQTGLYVLRFGTQWLSVFPTDGVIPPGESIEVAVSFDAAGLPGGDYSANILVFNNDPDAPEIIVPTHLNVTGAPNIVVQSDTLNFGQAFVGYSTSINLIIENNGTDVLDISGISVDNEVFSFYPASLTIDYGSADTVVVTFIPTIVGNYSGILTIVSNDPDEGTVEILLSGSAVEPPVISVSADSLSADLFTNDSTQQIFTIANTGATDLVYDLSVVAVNKNIVENVLPGKSRTKIENRSELMKSKENISKTASVDKKTKKSINIRELLGLESITLLSKKHGNVITKNNLSSSNLNINNNKSTRGWTLLYTDPDEPELTYDFGNVYGNTGGGDIAFMFETYVAWEDTAGLGLGVIVVIDADQDSTTGYYIPEYEIGAEFIIIGFPFLGLEMGLYDIDDYGDIFWNSPLTVYEIESNSNTVLVGVSVANMGDPDAVDFYGWGGAVNWEDGDLVPDVYSGHISWDLTPSWLKLSSEGGIIPAGSQEDITVTFDATDMFGGDYYANILVSSNDPANSELSIPAHLSVTGIPIYSGLDSVDLGISYVGYENVTTFVIENIGTDVLEISEVTSDNAQLSISPTTLSIPPISSDTLLLVLLAESEGLFNAAMTISTNDPNANEVSVTVQSTVLLPPIISVEPQSITQEIASGDTAVQSLTISNNGGSDLFWEISLETVRDETENILSPSDLVNLVNKPQYDKTNSSYSPIRENSEQPSDFLNDQGVERSNMLIGIADCYARYGRGELEVTLTELGYDFVTVYSVYDAENKGVNAIISGYGECFGDVDNLTNYIEAGGGYIQNGDWAWWFPVSYIDTYIDSIEISIVDREHVITLGLPDSWNAVGFWHYNGYGYLSWVSDNVFSDVFQGNVYESTYNRVVTADRVGDGYAVHIGFCMFGPDAGENSLALFANALEYVTTGSVIGGWLSFSQTSGITSMGSSDDVTVTFDASGLSIGNYQANVNILSNDPASQEVPVLINLTVTGADVKDEIGLPEEFALHQNFPNPFNPITTIQYDLPEMSDVKLVIYDLLGREVITLTHGIQEAGYRSVIWNGRDRLGREVATGIYIYQLMAGDPSLGSGRAFVSTKKLVLIK